MGLKIKNKVEVEVRRRHWFGFRNREIWNNKIFK